MISFFESTLRPIFDSIDQWAIAVLLSLSQLLGVTELPKEPDPNWQVVQNWKQLPDKSYELIIESKTIPKYCKENPEHFIVFPQSYMGSHEVIADGQVIATNTNFKTWYIETALGATEVSCQLIISKDAILYKLKSLVGFFASISSYPKIEPTHLRSNLFRATFFLIAFGVCLSLAVVGWLVLTSFMRPEVSSVNYVLQQLLFSVLMACYVPGYFIEIAVYQTYPFIFIGLWGGFFTFYFNLTDAIYRAWWILCLAILVSTLLCCIGYNAFQLGLLVPIIPCFVMFILAAIKILISGERSEVPKFFLLVVMIIVAGNDTYVTFVSREGEVHLSLLVMLMSSYSFWRIIDVLIQRSREIAVIKQKIIDEKRLVGTVNGLYEESRQLIHDIKSPISSLNLILFNEFKDNALLSKLNTRIDGLLKTMGDTGFSLAPDWFFVDIFMSAIEEVVEEKRYTMINNTMIKIVPLDFISGEQRVFFNPLDLKAIVSELLDNSRKAAGERNLNIEIMVLRVENGFLEFKYVDDGPGVGKNFRLSEKGLSTSGSTGLGLYGIERKVKNWGGYVEIVRVEKGFCYSIRAQLE